MGACSCTCAAFPIECLPYRLIYNELVLFVVTELGRLGECDPAAARFAVVRERSEARSQ